MSRSKDNIFYGWVIVAVSLIISAIFIGIRFSFGVFFKSIQGEFDLTRAMTSSVFSVHMLLGAAFAILSGWALDKYGPRSVVLIMGLFTGISLLLTSQATSLWQIYLSYSLLLAAGTAGSSPVLMATVSKWFDKRRGFAIGIAASGPGLGTLVVAPLAAFLIFNLGWRMSYIVLGLAALLIVVPLTRLLRRDPNEMGILPDGASLSSQMAEPPGTGANAHTAGLSLRQALKTRNFWILISIFVLLTFNLTLIMTHVVPYATDIGISIVGASTIISVMSASQILFRILIGRLSDTVGRKVPGITCAIIATGALILLTGARELWMLYIFAALFGLAWGGIGVICLALIGDSFKGRNLGVIMGTLQIGSAAGSAIGPALGGIIFDTTGSYVMAFAIAAAAMLALALFTALIKYPKP